MCSDIHCIKSVSVQPLQNPGSTSSSSSVDLKSQAGYESNAVLFLDCGGEAPGENPHWQHSLQKGPGSVSSTLWPCWRGGGGANRALTLILIRGEKKA